MDRPSLFRKQTGGRLNGVEGTITGLELTTVFPFGEGTSKFKDAGTPIYAVLTVRPDGADEDIIEPLKAGKEEDFTIEDDAMSLTPANEGQGIHPSSKFGKLLGSLVENSNGQFSEENLGFTNWPENRLNFGAMVGARVKFTRVKDAELQEKFGKKKDKKSGKEYDRDYLAVAEVFSVAASKGKSGKPSAGKSKAVEFDAQDAADTVLPVIVEKAGGTLLRARLSAQAQVMLTAKHPLGAHKSEILAVIMDPTYLEDADTRGIIGYDAKKQVLSVAA